MKRSYLVYIGILAVISTAIITFWLLTSGSSIAWANVPTTSVEISRDSIDLQTIRYDEHPTVTFTLKNTGDQPLLIRDIITTCGCTNPEWNKRPTLPGKTTDINVTFKPNSLGRFTKTIQVLCNTSSKTHELKLVGYVVEDNVKPFNN